MATPEEIREQFEALAAEAGGDLALDRGALLIAAEEDPRLDVEGYLRRLDDLGAEAARHDRADADSLVRVMGLANLLFEQWGFRGNLENYYDVRNSFLHEVIDRRRGIPITLSVLFLEIGRRIGLRMQGVGMPGHFIVKFADGDSEILLDPFHGGRLLSIDSCREMIDEMYGGTMPFRMEFLAAVTNRQILVRMLQNLKGIYSKAGEYKRALAVIDRILLLSPSLATELRDRGLILYGMGRYAQARGELEAYLRQVPDAPDARDIQERITQAKQQLARLN